MSVVHDIFRTYRAPRQVVRARLGATEREDRALAILMGGCALMFIAQWPFLAREAYVDASITVEARLAAALFGWLLMAPLFFYALAWVVHLVFRAFRAGLTGYGARVALFWAILAASPLWLLNGLVGGFIGRGLEMTLTGLLAVAAFLLFWFVGLLEATNPKSESAV